LFLEVFDTIHPKIAPVITKARVLIFNIGGRFTLSIVIGIDQIIIDPVIIERIDIIIIGFTTILSSIVEEFGLCSRGPQIVTIDNRIE